MLILYFYAWIFVRPDGLVLQEGRLYRLFPYAWYFVWYTDAYNFLGFYFVDTGAYVTHVISLVFILLQQHCCVHGQL